MTVSQCGATVTDRLPGAREGQVGAVTVTIIVIVTVCAGMSPEWLSAAAALAALLINRPQQ
ncbi:hypothetical protein ACH4FX_38810 [Streptomyces sp. NPDC018019]|uniref:hypothetical protein n=1 Tax=Streptomyces sp. NPDC018019 TaxID=3365030 RepID=UPI0037A4378D